MNAIELVKSAKNSFKISSTLSADIKNKILSSYIYLLNSKKNLILEANKLDIENARKNNIGSSKVDRLIFDEKKINSCIESVEEVITLSDPVGKIIYETRNEKNGLNIKRVTTPLGVILAIYESRPNVTSDIATLSLKSGNVSILRSGSDSYFTSLEIFKIFKEAIIQNNVNGDIVNFVTTTNREYINELLKLDNYIDVVIPRGGKDLIQKITEISKIPMFKHLDGNCHTYIHHECNYDKALEVVLNAKLRRVSICGATESILIDKLISEEFIKKLINALKMGECEMRVSKELYKLDNSLKLADENDFYTEYLDKIVSIKIVEDFNEAINHINKYGSSHTDSIITESEMVKNEFFKRVDSAIVMHNCSTQFADGGEFGFGAEVGIATGRMHARGPVGLEQLVTYKYVISADYAKRS